MASSLGTNKYFFLFFLLSFSFTWAFVFLLLLYIYIYIYIPLNSFCFPLIGDGFWAGRIKERYGWKLEDWAGNGLGTEQHDRC